MSVLLELRTFSLSTAPIWSQTQGKILTCWILMMRLTRIGVSIAFGGTPSW